MIFGPRSTYHNYRRPKVVNIGAIAICIALSLLSTTQALAHPQMSSADRPGTASLVQGNEQTQPAEPVAGVISTAIQCLSTADMERPADMERLDADQSPGCARSGVVRLRWQGEVERARLVMRLVEGSEPRTVTVNGQATVTVPALSPLALSDVGGEFFYLSIPPEAVLQGENYIEVSSRPESGQPESGRPESGADAWTATDVRIQVFGKTEGSGLIPQPSEIGSTTAQADGIASVVQATINFTNSYDQTRQEAAIQIPDGYNSGTPTPLVVFAHPRGAVMSYGLDVLGAAANTKRWLLASPEMHGSYKPPRKCYTDPDSCEYFEQILVDKPGAFAYASPESQYDVIGTVRYMVDHYNVKRDQIYLVGYSMGGQIAVVTGAKFPHVFAAVFDNKGPTDATRWYYEQVDYYPQGADAYQVVAMRKECHVNNKAKTPAENPLCYERRSGVKFAGNFIHVPISMTHSANDLLVPVLHSQEMRDEINDYNPDQWASIYYAPAPCGSPYHCFEPDPLAVLNWLGPFTLNQTPDHIHITSDESKPYYWMNLVQAEPVHWTQVEATRQTTSPTVVVWAKDNSALTVGLNLGSAPMMTEVGEQPGLGLPATTYLVLGAGHNELQEYASDYFNVTLGATPAGATFTVSALRMTIAAVPALLSVVQGSPQAAQAQLTIQAEDHLGNPVPNGTPVQVSATDGKFPNGSAAIVLTTTNGRATTTLTADETTASNVEVSARVGSVEATTQVTVLHPGIALSITTDQATVHGGESVNFTYEVENTGDCTLTGVRVVDDNGTPGVSGDDVTVCSGITLAAGETRVCTRSAAPAQTMTATATASGQDASGSRSEAQDWTKVTVIHPSVDVRLSAEPGIIYQGQEVWYHYAITNTGDVTLTQIAVVDSDMTVCGGITLSAGGSTACSRSTSLQETKTLTVTATGLDPLGRAVSDGDGATIQVLSPGIELEVRPDSSVVYGGVPVIYEYIARNTGNAALDQVTILDDNGTPGESIQICSRPRLGPGASMTCFRSVTLTQTRTSVARVSGRDALNKEWEATDETTVQVGMSLWLPLAISGR